MKAVVWNGRDDVAVEDVPDPRLHFATDAILRITATGLCGSDLHLYGPMSSVMTKGEVLGHEGVGEVVEAGAHTGLAVGDRVVVPFNISCGTCFTCERGFQSQCETTQNRETGKGASLLGYTKLYGGFPGAQAEYLRVPFAEYGPIHAPEGVPDEVLVLMADVLPTAWQAVEYAAVPAGGIVGVWGLGPIGQMCARIALRRGAKRVVGIDRVPARLEMAKRHGVEVIDFAAVDDVVQEVRRITEGRGVDSAIDAVGMEAEGSATEDALVALKIQPDHLAAFRSALAGTRRGGTLSVIGVYIGMVPAFPLGEVFDRQVTIRCGQANVRRWTKEITDAVTARGDPLGVRDFVTHVVPLSDAPAAYRMFQQKEQGAVKVVFRP